MADYQAQLAGFRLNEELKRQFVDFEIGWKVKESPERSYKIITVVNNDINDPILEKEEKNAELA